MTPFGDVMYTGPADCGVNLDFLNTIVTGTSASFEDLLADLADTNPFCKFETEDWAPFFEVVKDVQYDLSNDSTPSSPSGSFTLTSTPSEEPYIVMTAPPTPETAPHSPVSSPVSAIESLSDSSSAPTELTCSNCFTKKTSTWRKHEGRTLCNACGLYEKARHAPRPLHLASRRPRRSPKNRSLKRCNSAPLMRAPRILPTGAMVAGNMHQRNISVPILPRGDAQGYLLPSSNMNSPLSPPAYYSPAPHTAGPSMMVKQEVFSFDV
eukprot:comp24574_c0_seq1/m.46781 comp24574_c0_seq1/g.46781  ORF comp24574_c0_seq1/g.46781 comp24574_c0_seq1/m.46781 type:complete len:266 (-) comp24574_c0_seq1:432-1229(-)